MIYSATSSVKALKPVSPYLYSPFQQAGYRQSTGIWAQSTPYQEYVKKAATGIADFLESAIKLQQSAQELSRKTSLPFQARETKSSNPSVISVQAKDGASVQSYRVQVYSLASAQKNSGTDMARGDQATELQAGVQSLKLSIGGREKTVSVNIAATDTNEQGLGKLRDAINGAKMGVTANLITDQQSGKARLELTSDRTGTDNAFTLTDETGNAAAWSGISEVKEQASNASYSVNGAAAQSSQTNAVDLEKGKATATLLQTTDSDATVDVRVDSKKAMEQASKLIGNYNETINRLRDSAGYVNPLIRKSFDGAVSGSEYGSIGIRKNSDGTLRLDEKAFQASLSSDPERAARALGGIARGLEKEAVRFQDVPASALLNKNMMALQQFASYQSTMQSFMQIPTTGLLVNSFF